MRKGRFSEAQIVQILAEYDTGAAMEELARRHGVHANTIRLWRSKYAGMKRSVTRQCGTAYTIAITFSRRSTG